MPIGALCSRVVATAGPDDTIQDAAGRMKEYGVGTLVVVGQGKRPQGIVTDRDLVVRCVASGLGPAGTPISEIMSSPVCSGHEAMSLAEALEAMQAQGARRMVVTGDDGELVGILSLDDARRMGAILEKQGRRSLAAAEPSPVGGFGGAPTHRPAP